MSAHRLLQDLLMAEYEVPDVVGKVIPVKKSLQQVQMVIAASTAETNTLEPAKRSGIFLTLVASEVGSSGTRAVTLTAGTLGGGSNTVMTFNAAGDLIVLMSARVGTAIKWFPIYNNSVALS